MRCVIGTLTRHTSRPVFNLQHWCATSYAGKTPSFSDAGLSEHSCREGDLEGKNGSGSSELGGELLRGKIYTDGFNGGWYEISRFESGMSLIFHSTNFVAVNVGFRPPNVTLAYARPALQPVHCAGAPAALHLRITRHPLSQPRPRTACEPCCKMHGCNRTLGNTPRVRSLTEGLPNHAKHGKLS